VAPRQLVAGGGQPHQISDRWRQLFRSSWAALHRRALQVQGPDDAWLAAFAARLPCGPCRRHWDGLVQANPPDWYQYFAWTVQRHNDINAMLGKPLYTVEAAYARWKPVSLAKP
jgi:hypothetical protein